MRGRLPRHPKTVAKSSLLFDRFMGGLGATLRLTQMGSKSRSFFCVFLKASGNIGGGRDGCAGGGAAVVLSPADPLGRALKSKDTIVQYDTKTDNTEVNIF